MDSGLFSLGTDESNDESGIKKLNPVLIRWFGDNKGKVSAQLLDMGDGYEGIRYGGWKEGTAEALFNNIESILREKKVD